MNLSLLKILFLPSSGISSSKHNFFQRLLIFENVNGKWFFFLHCVFFKNHPYFSFSISSNHQIWGNNFHSLRVAGKNAQSHFLCVFIGNRDALNRNNKMWKIKKVNFCEVAKFLKRKSILQTFFTSSLRFIWNVADFTSW